MSQLWEPGNYKGNLTSLAFGKSGNGTPQCVATFDIDGNNKLVFMYLSDGARDITFEQLEKLGWNGSTTSPAWTSGDDVELYMKVEAYEGKDREKWAISGGGFKAEPMALDESKRIEALWKNRGKAGGKTAPTKPAPTKTTAPSRAPSKPAFGKDEAWDAFEKAKKTSTEFFEVIEAVEADTGKKEAAFTEAEWKIVATASGIPF